MEYKEEFTELTQSEEVVENTTEETVEEVVENTTDATLEAESFETEVPAETVSIKKKNPFYLPVIIAACLVVGAIVAFLAISIFTPTVEGTWVYEAEDGNSFYYTFSKDECDMNIGTIHFPGTYTLDVTDEAKTMNIEIYAGYLSGACEYEITGNRLAKNRVMTLTNAEGTTFTLKQTKAQKDSDYIMPDENFKEVEKLTGEWEFEYAEYNSSLKLTLNDDGTMIYDQFGYQELHCVYTATDSKINLSFFETELISQEEEYYFDGDQLIFLGLNWTRVGAESTSDEA